MDRCAIFATLDAQPGKEREVEAFLKSAQALVAQEVGTTTWFAFRAGPATFGIFDTFASDDGLQAHLNGEIAKALFARAEELFAKPLQIQQLDIFAAKPYAQEARSNSCNPRLSVWASSRIPNRARVRVPWSSGTQSATDAIGAYWLTAACRLSIRFSFRPA